MFRQIGERCGGKPSESGWHCYCGSWKNVRDAGLIPGFVRFVPSVTTTMSDSLPAHASTVLAYHQRTAHRFEAYARGPEALDWDAQPAPFRHFVGAPSIALPHLGAEVAESPLGLALSRPFGQWATPIPVAADLASLGALFQLSLGITAWKSLGPDRWAVRANPSSGNLHPLEAYLIVEAWPGLDDGVYHYCPEDHRLEQRARFQSGGNGGRPRAWIGLSSVMWREAWKYGERAFRYCQLDVGHGMAALAYSGAMLGWHLKEQTSLGHGGLAGLLGLDRREDFPWKRKSFTEQEEPEMLLRLTLPDEDPATTVLPDLLSKAQQAQWSGRASPIDQFLLYEWGSIAEVAMATRRPDMDTVETILLPSPFADRAMAGTSAKAVILQRRSAQRFDPARVMARQDFLPLLTATRPCQLVPWLTPARPSALNLLLYVHRVEGLEPGIYFYARHPESAAPLLEHWQGRGMASAMDAYLPGLTRLAVADPVQLRRVARSLHCHQDIAANACLALGMVAALDHGVGQDPGCYRDLHREAGVIGQVLYLEAQARDYQGTGIGCFFDEPVREVVSLEGTGFRTLYHFTIGGGVADPRIETGPAYG